MSVPSWVYSFASPASATGEDVVELHLPGNPLLARMVLDEVVRLGARQAVAGEFTSRSYFNGKVDLSEAEGIAAAIGAQSERELRAARQLMAGELARRLRPTMDSLADTLALIEAGIDFTDQDISFLSSAEVAKRVEGAREGLVGLLQESRRFERISHEPRIVLAGRPNAGKSTLLNALAGHERAIVSHVAGTTRDVLTAHVRLARGTVCVIDVAGLEPTSADHTIDQAKQAHAHRAIEEADLVALVQDCTDMGDSMALNRTPDLQVITKLDLHSERQAGRSTRPCSSPARPGLLMVSARTGEGMTELRNELDRLCFGQQGGEATLTLNARHVGLIEQAQDALERAEKLLPPQGLELLAMELRETLDLLGEVLGSITPDDVLGRVFSRFCIGK